MAGDSNGDDKELSPITPRELTLNEPDEKQVQESGIVATRYQGPIPPPEMLAALERVKPGLADRVITMAENAQ